MPPMTLRVNRRRADVARCLAELAAAGIEASALGGEAIRLLRPQPVERIPGFAEGRVSVQDAGAQRAAELLAATTGERVLDACAAPGGKTSHLLERAEVELLALDVDAGRCRRIEENLARLGLAATVAAGDAATPASWWDGRPFDRILADVPCSATGVVRRHPDAKWLRREADIDALAKTQDRLLDALWSTLKPGGLMLYVTCSVFPRENGERVAAFVRRTADAMRVPIDGQPDLQLLPSADHDGFFYARLQKNA
jgi:16S rRNA (cytosine967-C5)-methyltransferase